MCTTPSATTPAPCTTCGAPSHPAAYGYCMQCALAVGGCLACGFSPCTTCTPGAVCGHCGQHQACTACGVCQVCGMCPLCVPCQQCPQCATGNGAACHACYGAKGAVTYSAPCPQHPGNGTCGPTTAQVPCTSPSGQHKVQGTLCVTCGACTPACRAQHNGAPTPTHTTVCMVCCTTAKWPYPCTAPACAAKQAWRAAHQH